MLRHILTQTSFRRMLLAIKVLTHLLGTAISIAYAYLSLTSPLGLAMEILMGLGSLFMTIVIIYNTVLGRKMLRYLPATLSKIKKLKGLFFCAWLFQHSC